MSVEQIDTLDRASDLLRMLTAISFGDLTREGEQGVHATIARIIEQLDHAKGLAAR